MSTSSRISMPLMAGFSITSWRNEMSMLPSDSTKKLRMIPVNWALPASTY